MALKNYEELDEDAYYGQDFERENLVSLWASNVQLRELPEGIDVLQDLCGVGYYSIDSNELVERDGKTLSEMVSKLSYIDSFVQRLNDIEHLISGDVRWIVAQYNFEYRPTEVKREISDVVKFLGVFPFNS